MAELRHSASLGSRAASSPMKRDEDSMPFVAEVHDRGGDDDDDERHASKDRDRGFLSSLAHTACPFFFADDSRVPPHSFLGNDSSFKIFVAFIALLLLAALASFPSIWNRLNAPYLCTKDGIVLRCPPVKELPSLWENPYSATTSWKPCAERRRGGISDLPLENETTGYILIHAEGGLNQQRIAICNAVAVAKIMNATLILPLLKQDQIWKDQTKFEDIFDVDHFIEYLKDDVRIVRHIPDWFPDRAELFTSIRFARCYFILPVRSFLHDKNPAPTSYAPEDYNFAQNGCAMPHATPYNQFSPFDLSHHYWRQSYQATL